MKPHSLMRRIDAYFTAHRDGGLSLTEACRRFGCTPEQLYRAMRKANHILGLGLGMEPFFRIGPTRRVLKAGKRQKAVPIRPKVRPLEPNVALSSIFRLGTGDAGPTEPRIVETADGIVRVRRIAIQDTPEWQEKEAARRARQKPPRPPAKAKTRGKKVREWDGEKVE